MYDLIETGGLAAKAEVTGLATPLADGFERPDLLRDRAYVGGAWCDAGDGRRLAVTDPAAGSLLGTVPDMGEREALRAVEAAAGAFPAWRATPARERGAILRRWAGLMLRHKEDLARIMTLEQGKPLAESRGEIDYAASFLDWFGEEAKRLYGETIPSHLPGSALMVVREPVGVAAAITPWNFPSAMITRKAGAALATGCTMVVRPASETPFSALALAALAEEAGVPAGVLSVVTGDPVAIGDVLTGSPVVKALSFTGSTEVGRKLLRQCANTVKKVLLELGGHAPFILLEDADLDGAVKGAIGAKFATSGQDCLAANRIYVPSRLHDAFARRFAAATAALKVGPGLEPGVEIGPLMHEKAVRKCEAHVADAVAKGARVLVGGARHELGGTFFAPTVLADITDDMLIAREETFGPVAALMRYEDEAEVVARANATIYGLAAYVYGSGLRRVMRVAGALDYGMVAVNTPKFTGAPVPFGGTKQSGLGREGSRHGTDDYIELKYFCLGGLD
jgi:succinate-semialdehyde dehydrogenase / glutarate-semialdehyde dehydrogenase